MSATTSFVAQNALPAGLGGTATAVLHLLGVDYFSLLGGVMGAVGAAVVMPPKVPPDKILVGAVKTMLGSLVGAYIGALLTLAILSVFDFLAPGRTQLLVLLSMLAAVGGWGLVVIGAGRLRQWLTSALPGLLSKRANDGADDGGKS